MMEPEPVRTPPQELLPFPDQERVYGAIGGDHDARLADLRARIEQTGKIAPVVVSRNTPGLPRGTIISGHRRAAVATLLGWLVPVQWEDFSDYTEAKAAWLAFNEQREKDEWVKTQEALAWREVEADRAKQRMSAGGGDRSAGYGTGAIPGQGTTRDKVAGHLGESGKTTELRFKLGEKAREQNPENPAASPVATALREGKAVKTVAREFGVLPAAPPARPPNKGVDSPPSQNHAGIVPTSTPKPTKALAADDEGVDPGEVRPEDIERIDTTGCEPPAPEKPLPAHRDLDEMQTSSRLISACDEFLVRIAALLGDGTVRAMREPFRAGVEGAFVRVISGLSEHVDFQDGSNAPRWQPKVLHGGK